MYKQIFETAQLDGAAMCKWNGRSVEVAVRKATQGEAWVDDLLKVRNLCLCANLLRFAAIHVHVFPSFSFCVYAHVNSL